MDGAGEDAEDVLNMSNSVLCFIFIVSETFVVVVLLLVVVLLVGSFCSSAAASSHRRPLITTALANWPALKLSRGPRRALTAPVFLFFLAIAYVSRNSLLHNFHLRNNTKVRVRV